MKAFDVVVVGARVAGAATALHLARAGHDVLIVDRVGPPADTISTHALMRSGVLSLRRANVLDRVVEAGTPEIRQVGLVFGSEQISFPVADEWGVDAYYAPRRTVLDAALLDVAMEAGVTFISGLSVTSVLRAEGGRVAGVSVRTAEGDASISARQVVGADGTNSRIAREVEAPTLYFSKATNAVVYSYFQGIPTSGYDFRFLNHRNVGLIPTNDGLSLLFVGGPLSEAPVDSEEYLITTLRRVAPDLAEAVGSATRTERFYRAKGIPNLLRDPGGDGWSLVGDAGFTEDPIAAHGITDALRDAELCAEAVSTSLRDPSLEVEAKSRYREVRNRFANSLLEATVPLANFEWDGAEASQLLRKIGEVAEDECELLTSRSTFSLV
ncbi:MAG TPA: FAD-dependent oxidoreductase [Acidimicrobiia bacterium]|nr:FAD-dependent oxidoreductase [Acidimicrobiia bacterium]